MFGSVSAYEKIFVPTEGGYLFYPSNWSRGYLISPEERDQLVADWREVASFKSILKMVVLAVIAIMAIQLASMALGIENQTQPYIGYGIGLIYVGYIGWRNSAVYRLVRGREPVAPRRTAEENRQAIGRMVPLPMLFLVFAGISLSSASLLWLGLRGNWLAGLFGLLLAWSAYAYLRIILTRLKSHDGV